MKAESIASSLGTEIVSILHISEGAVRYHPYRVDVEYLKAPETPIVPRDVQGSALSVFAQSFLKFSAITLRLWGYIIGGQERK